MEKLNKQPYFTLHIEAPEKHFSWCIAKDGVVIHHIDNIKKFSKLIGYPDVNPSVINDKGEVARKVTSADHEDFISHTCTQTKIAAYIVERCEKSRLVFAEHFNSLLQSCNNQKATKTAECSNCIVNKFELVK